MDFQNETLVKKYGSWMRVQVAFYDFLFETGSELCAKHFRETAVESVLLKGEWADGGGFYETVVAKLEAKFATAEEAWKAFIEAER